MDFNADKFDEMISGKLTGLSRTRVVFFAWICAVRVLPFLGVQGNFNYWNRPYKYGRDKLDKYLVYCISNVFIEMTKYNSSNGTTYDYSKKNIKEYRYNKKKQQKYLFSLLNILDVLAPTRKYLGVSRRVKRAASEVANVEEITRGIAWFYVTFFDSFSKGDYKEYNSFEISTTDVEDMINCMENMSKQSMRASFAIIVINYVCATFIAEDAEEAYSNAIEAAKMAVLVMSGRVAKAISRIVTESPAAHTTCTPDVTDLLIQDIDTIIEGKYNFNCDLSIYGGIWDDFQKALRNLDCSYWGEWYTALFEKGLLLDNDCENEIGMRLSVPKRIQKRGAAAVACYVAKSKKNSRVSLKIASYILIIAAIATIISLIVSIIALIWN
jgi:hypothetical protein